MIDGGDRFIFETRGDFHDPDESVKWRCGGRMADIALLMALWQ